MPVHPAPSSSLVTSAFNPYLGVTKSFCCVTLPTILHLTARISITSDVNPRSSLSRWSGTRPLLHSPKQLLCVWSVYTLVWHTGRLTPVTLPTGASSEFEGDERGMQMSAFSQSLSCVQFQSNHFYPGWSDWTSLVDFLFFCEQPIQLKTASVLLKRAFITQKLIFSNFNAWLLCLEE